MALLSTKTGLPSFSAVDASIVNYFTDPGFERGTDGTLPSGWLQYNDGAVAVPVNGTGGSANASVTLLTTTAGAIRGTKSALLTKGPGNQQGTGYSYDFTISNVDKGVTAGVDFEMLTSAGYVSGDMVFYIYDVTNSILITPRAVSLPALPNYGRFFSDYGLQSGTQYRFILHIATTNASAWTMILDTMTNSTTRTAVPGAPVFVYETVNTFTIGAVTTPPTPGAGATFLRVTERDGEYANIRWEYRHTVAGSAGSGAYLLPLPDGLTINYNKAGALSPSTFNGVVGQAAVGGTQNFAGFSGISNSGAYVNKVFAYIGNDLTANSEWSSSHNPLSNAFVSATITARIPITQWAGSGTNFITDNLIESNARVRYYRNAAYSYTSGTTFAWDAVDTTTYQTNGNWTNSSGEISVPATGLYQILATIQASALLASDPQLEIWVSRQGGAYAQERVIDREASAGYKSSGSAAIYLRLGDKFQIRLGSNASVVTGTVNTFLEVFRVTDVSSRGPIGFGLAGTDGSSGLVAPYSTSTGLIYGGQYTPTVTAGTNVTGTTAFLCNYSRVGRMVLVTGYCTCTTTAAAFTASALFVSLPIASNFNTGEDATGTAIKDGGASGVAMAGGYCTADAVNDRVQVTFNNTTTSNTALSFSFQYILK